MKKISTAVLALVLSAGVAFNQDAPAPGERGGGGGFVHVSVPAVWPPFMLKYRPEDRYAIWWWTNR